MGADSAARGGSLSPMSTPPVAVVTGGTGALGRSLLPLLLRRRFKVAVTYLVPDEATRVEKELDVSENRLMIRRVDCTDITCRPAYATPPLTSSQSLVLSSQ